MLLFVVTSPSPSGSSGFSLLRTLKACQSGFDDVSLSVMVSILQQLLKSLVDCGFCGFNSHCEVLRISLPHRCRVLILPVWIKNVVRQWIGWAGWLLCIGHLSGGCACRVGPPAYERPG